MRVARVVVDVPARALDRVFDYDVPESMSQEVGIGVPVLVDFGGRDAVAYVVDLATESEVERRKPVRCVLGGPLFGESAFEVARFVADAYVSGLAEALRLFLPPGGSPRIEREGATYRLRPPEVTGIDERYVELTDAADPAGLRANATLQRAVLDSLARGPVRMAELRAQLGAVDAAVGRLTDRGYVSVTRRRRVRRPGLRATGPAQPLALTPAQRAALDRVTVAVENGETVLLDGVTGSGKTEVYLQAIAAVLEDDGTARVPGTPHSRTPPPGGRFRARFGDAVAVLHSRLSRGERFDQWRLALEGEVSVVVGPRSALFAPLSNVRLIVLDEEHDPSYKQASAPRYHARDVARVLARVTGAALVLGSATPCMESRHAVDERAYVHVRLLERVGDRRLPETTVVDMGAEFAAGHRSMFSRPLLDELATVAETGRKAMLLLNRRGFASFLLCRECGHVPECRSCSVSLTYHEVGTRLVCHHCGLSAGVPATCPACGSPYLRRFGAGTQRVEAELTAAFPALPIVRMDADTTRGKGGHERRLAEFEALHSGVLLGTQMIAKGHDFPEVTLVGVVDADTALHLPDFRAAERTYQLLEQVAGRAGRGALPGRVVVQTYWPDHPAIRAAASHDPSILYEREDAIRRELGYPPYGRLARLLVSGADLASVRERASDLAGRLRLATEGEASVLGPVAAPISRVRGTHRWHLLVKARPGAVPQEWIRPVLEKRPAPRGVAVAVDIDPADFM